MRSIAAVVLIALGVVVGAIGVLQKTVWAQPKNIVAAVETPADAAMAVVEPGVLGLYPGPAHVTVTGKGSITVAQAPKANVDAWLGETPHMEITGLKSHTELNAQVKSGKSGEAPDPAGADLWENSVTNPDSATYEWRGGAGTAALLIGSSEAQQPLTVSISWKNSHSHPWAVLLMILGVLLIVIGILLFISGRRAKERERQRMEQRRERRRRLAQLGSAFVIVPALGLAGCSSELPQPAPVETPTKPVGSVTDEQLKRILSEVAQTIGKADAAGNAKELAARADGPFLHQREAAYAVRKKDKKAALPPVPVTDEVKVNYTSAVDSWPRITSAVVSGQGQTQLLVLSQADPRSDYRLWAQAVLLPGAEFPQVNDAKQGSNLLPADAQGYDMTPKDAVKAYADKLERPNRSKTKNRFDKDAFAQQELDTFTKTKKELKKGNATISTKYAPGQQLTAQETADGSMIVVGTAVCSVAIAPESRGGSSGELTLPDPQAKLVGSKKTNKKLTSRYEQTYALVVPKKGAGKIRLIGVTSTLIGAKLSGS